MTGADVLIVNALKMEFDAARHALAGAGANIEEGGSDTESGYVAATLPTLREPLRIALARPTRMGATAAATIAASLTERLRPRCLGMSGVCAGNPAEVALGDVVVAEVAYQYDEGKRTRNGFEGDHRQIPLRESWLRKAQEFDPSTLPSYGEPAGADRRAWLLEQLVLRRDPARHPARDRYFSWQQWTDVICELEADGSIKRVGQGWRITKSGRAAVDAARAYHLAPIDRLPFAVHTGPMASGNVVIKDGVTWELLKAMGVRSVLGLEMEAAAIAQVAHRSGVPHWIVVKGVMDFADPRKEDRLKPFAARASAEVLWRLLQSMPMEPAAAQEQGSRNLIGNVTGSHISISQSYHPPKT